MAKLTFISHHLETFLTFECNLNPDVDSQVYEKNKKEHGRSPMERRHNEDGA